MRKTDDEWSTHLGCFNPAQGPVRNPGMGVIGYVFSDHMHVGHTAREWHATQAILPQLPPDRESIRKMAALPLIDCLYIRCEWRDIQKKAGELCLPAPWEWMLEEAEANHKPWSFRIMNHSPHSIHDNSLPDFLQNKFEMLPYDPIDDGRPRVRRYFPRYTDEYLKWWNEMVHLLGARFDKSPLLSFGDVSGYGHWGEFHHDDQHKRKHEPAKRIDAILESLIRGHAEAFPLTPAVLNTHFAEFAYGLKAVQEKKFWLRKDSFGINTIATQLLRDTCSSGNAMIWETILFDDDGDGSEVFGLVQRYLDIGCSFASIGFNAWIAIYGYEHYLPVYQKLQERIGYRLRPTVVWKRQFLNEPPELVAGLVNDGSVGPPGEVSMHVEFSGGARVTCKMSAGQPVPGALAQACVTIPPGMEDCESATLSLDIRIKGKVQAVRWAVATPDGKPPMELRVPVRKPYDQRGVPVGDGLVD